MANGARGRSTEDVDPIDMSTTPIDHIDEIDIGLENINVVSETVPTASEQSEGTTLKSKGKNNKRPRPHAEIATAMLHAFESSSTYLMSYAENDIASTREVNLSINRMADIQEKKLKMLEDEKKLVEKKKEDVINIVWGLPTLTTEEKFRALKMLRSPDCATEFMLIPPEVREEWLKYNIG
jgi:hypothetical protein